MKTLLLALISLSTYSQEILNCTSTDNDSELNVRIFKEEKLNQYDNPVKAYTTINGQKLKKVSSLIFSNESFIKVDIQPKINGEKIMITLIDDIEKGIRFMKVDLFYLGGGTTKYPMECSLFDKDALSDLRRW